VEFGSIETIMHRIPVYFMRPKSRGGAIIDLCAFGPSVRLDGTDFAFRLDRPDAVCDLFYQPVLKVTGKKIKQHKVCHMTHFTMSYAAFVQSENSKFICYQ
jgi:hypothetical protein